MKTILTTAAVLIIGSLGLSAQVADSPQDIAPLLISEKIPSVLVTSMKNIPVPLPKVVSEGPTVLLIYRGGWCPYCNAHLSDIKDVEDDVRELGYRIVAVSLDSPGRLKETAGKHNLGYELYSDASGKLVEAMGLAFKAPERYTKKLNDYSGSKNPGLLPVPSLFVVEPGGTILFEYICPDYTHRISSGMLVSVLKELNREED